MTRTIGLAMSFLTLCCKTSPRLCCGISVSALLSTVATYVSREDTSYLSYHLLTLLSSLGSSRGHIPTYKSLNVGSDKIPWEIALSCPRSDMLMACKFAHVNEILSLEFTSASGLSVSRILRTFSRTTWKPSHIYCYRDLGLLEKCPALNSHWALHR